jgi:Copper amine oxidase N-terminal domain.
MKHKMQLVVAFLCGAVFFSGISFAANEFIAKPVNYKIVVNGEEKILDRQPMSIENSTYLPIRTVGEAIGYKVSYSKGVVSLTNQENDDPISNNEQTTNLDGSNSRYTFEVLPMTKESADGVSITVHSIEIYDSHTEFDITVTNNSGWDRRVNFRESFVYDYNISGKVMKQSGTVDEGIFQNEIKDGETVRGILKKGNIDKDASNVILRTTIKGLEFPIKLK